MPFYSKLLLFGEYAIIQGSQALAVPLPRYSCEWVTAKDLQTGTTSRAALRNLLRYLERLKKEGWMRFEMDLQRFEAEIQAGLYLKSNIPIGYGLGSSGALSAAVYDRFGIDKIEKEDADRFEDLRLYLGMIESHFHGASSGVDPLICFLNQAVLIKAGGKIERVHTPDLPAPSELQFFLLDTKQARQTGPLVELFLQKCEDAHYAQRIDAELIPQTEEAIAAYLNGEWPIMPDLIHQLSHFQWKYFQEMIPKHLRPIWLESLGSDFFKLKLCGAGGGGFLLGVSTDVERLKEQLAGQTLLFL